MAIENFEFAPDGIAEFVPAKSNHLSKTLLWMPIVLLIGIIPLFLSGKSPSLNVVGITVALLLTMFGLIAWSITHSLKKTKILISRSGISSPMFKGDNKYYPWGVIETVALEMPSDQRFLQLKLNESATTLLNRKTPKKLTFPLIAFSPDVQEKIYETSNLYWREFLARNGQVVPAYVNQFKEENQFANKLKALAPIVWTTWGLIAVNTLICLAAIAQGTNIMENPADMLLAWGGNATSEVQRGQWWRLLTSTFLHGGLVHLAMNMLGLWSVGSIVERLYGRGLFLLIYFASGLMGSALSLHFSASHSVSVGASGAIFGIAGALLVSVIFHKSDIPKGFWRQTSSGLAIFIFYSLMQGLSKQGIDNAAHMGGLIGGSVLALFLPTQLKLESFNKNAFRMGITGAFIAFTSAAAIAYYAPAAQVDLKQYFEVRTSFIATTTKLVEAVKQLQKEAEDVKSQKMTAVDQDERTRTIWAPIFKKLYDEYDSHPVQATDQLFPLVQDYKRLTQLLQESLQMDSVINPITNLPESVNPQRTSAIDVELKEVMARINKVQKTSPHP